MEEKMQALVYLSNVREQRIFDNIIKIEDADNVITITGIGYSESLLKEVIDFIEIEFFLVK